MKKNPKSSQLYFFCMPHEIDQLVQFIVEHDAKIMSGRSSFAKPYILNNKDSIGNTIYACPSQVIAEVKFNRLEDELYYLDFTISPVIEISLSVDRGGFLSRGRLYTRFGYDGRDGWVSYHESLAKLHKAIVYFLKKEILTKEKCFGAYCSLAALDFRRNGGELVQF